MIGLGTVALGGFFAYLALCEWLDYKREMAKPIQSHCEDCLEHLEDVLCFDCHRLRYQDEALRRDGY